MSKLFAFAFDQNDDWSFQMFDKDVLNTITKQFVEDESHCARIKVSEWKTDRKKFAIFCLLLSNSQESIADVTV